MGRYARPAVALAVAAIVVAAIVRAGLFDHFSVAGTRAWIEAWGALGPVVFMGTMMAGFFVPAPQMVLVGIGGAVFGVWPAFAFAWLAAVVGTALPFLLVRQAVGRYVQGPHGIRFARLRAVDERLVRHGFATVVLLRLLLYLAPPLNWALGASRVRRVFASSGQQRGGWGVSRRSISRCALAVERERLDAGPGP